MVRMRTYTSSVQKDCCSQSWPVTSWPFSHPCSPPNPSCLISMCPQCPVGHVGGWQGVAVARGFSGLCAEWKNGQRCLLVFVFWQAAGRPGVQIPSCESVCIRCLPHQLHRHSTYCPHAVCGALWRMMKHSASGPCL